MAAKSQFTTSEDGTRVVLTKSSVGGNSLKLVSLRAVVFPAATDRRCCRAATSRSASNSKASAPAPAAPRTVDATVMLTPDELRAWLAGVAALLPPAGGGDV